MSKRADYPFLAPLERRHRGGTTERVERVLKAAIVGLDFAPGEFLDKALVCARLGVSRFPVSEALGRLAAEGLVDILPQHGTRVARIRLAEIEEAMLIRSSLEAAVAEAAAQRLSEEALEDLRNNLARQQEAIGADDAATFHALDLAFHRSLVAGLGFGRIAAVIEGARANIDRVRRLLSSPGRDSATLAEHQAIVGAIEVGDGATARRTMSAHLEAVMEELRRFSRAHPQVFVDAPEVRPERVPAAALG